MTDMSHETTIDRLRAVPLFAAMSDDGIARLRDAASVYEVPAGHVLIQPDQAGTGLFVVDDGTVVVERRSGPVQLGPGEFIGELALLFDGAVHSVRVRAETPVRVIALAREDVTTLVESEPAVAVTMLRTLARRLWHAAR